ncbi:hypothetical protein DITRI_Ditri16bG0062800 [Diplodiscus trichospermus]
MGRSPCCDESGLKKGPWTPEEDKKLVKYIQEKGHGSWSALPKLAGLNRCGKSCRLRWTNYLRPDIKRAKFSQEEEQPILNLHSTLGNKPRTDILSSLPHLIALANLKELMDQHPWEDQTLRRQAEAVQMAKLQCLQYLLQNPPSISYGSNNYMHNTFIDMEIINLSKSLPPIKDNSVLSSPQQHIAAASLQGFSDSFPSPLLPDLEIPCEYRTSTSKDTAQAEYKTLSQGENTGNSPWLINASATTSPSVVPSVTESLINNLGDASYISSYEGSSPSVWPDDHLLLEDPLFHELSQLN